MLGNPPDGMLQIAADWEREHEELARKRKEIDEELGPVLAERSSARR
jgi:hypothetical protein